MKKLIIQIPCYNEEKTLGATLKDLPRKVLGVEKVEWLIIDDGSTDQTVDVAKAHGVDHIVSLPRHQGLARAFKAGIEAGVREGADVIVNTDADNQYCAADIPKLIQPIVKGRAEIVIGSRPINDIEHFSPTKKFLQKMGSFVIRHISKTSVPDAPSGFRAISREAAMRLNVFSEFTYTLETLIQAGQKNMAVESVPIRVNSDLRPSRLVKSIPRYIFNSLVTALRIFITYRPLQFFLFSGTIIFFIGFMIGTRFLVFFFQGEGEGHIQSLILAGLLMGMGFQIFIIGILADLNAVNRKLLEKIDWNVQKIEQEQACFVAETTEKTQISDRIRKREAKERESHPLPRLERLHS